MAPAHLLALATAVVSVSFAAPALGACASPQMKIIWSYPAEGATDVPTNARLFILTDYSQGLLRHPVVVNGELLNVDPNDTGLGMNPRLQPNRSYVIELPPLGHPSPPSLRFTTGATDAADSPPAPPIVDRTTVLADRVLSSTCSSALYLGTCFDTGHPEHLVLQTQSRPLFFVLDWSPPVVQAPNVPQSSQPPRAHSIFWPAECGEPEVFGWGGTCIGGYRVTAVGPSGQSASAEFVCESASSISPTPTNPAPPQPPGGALAGGGASGESAASAPSDRPSAGGCSAAGRPGGMSLVFLLIPAAAFVLRVARTARRSDRWSPTTESRLVTVFTTSARPAHPPPPTHARSPAPGAPA